MANKYLDSSLLDRAIIFAVKSHANQERRGKGFPYIVHPMEAVEIVASITPDQELLAAAALHDVVEDCGVSVEEIRSEFGERIASLVASESEPEVAGLSETDSWRMRKQAAIDRLAAACHDAKIVAMGDKLSNMRAIYRDYRVKRDELWNLFHAPNGKPDHEWHYRGLATALSDLAGTFAYREFVDLIGKVFGDPKPELINMDDYEESGDGYTAISYNHKDGDRMMKLYAEFIPRETPLTELTTSWQIEGLGLQIPKAYRMVTDGKRIGVEFQRIHPKESFARAMSNHPDQLEFYAHEFARETALLHSKSCPTHIFPNIKNHFVSEVEQNRHLTAEQKQRALDFIAAVPDTGTCIHGDLHFGNIITSNGKNYWIDLADFSHGHPYFDLGCLHLQCRVLPDWLIQKLYHITLDQMREAGDIVMRHFFPEAKDYKDIQRALDPFAALYIIGYDNRSEIFPGMWEIVEESFKGQ